MAFDGNQLAFGVWRAGVNPVEDICLWWGTGGKLYSGGKCSLSSDIVRVLLIVSGIL